MRSSRAPRNVQECLQVTWTRLKRKQKIPKHRKRKPSGPKAAKCLQNSTNSHAIEPDDELSKSIIRATQGPQGGCRATPGTTQAHGSTLPSVPGNAPGARGSRGTLQERSRDFLKGPKRQKRSPKLTKGQPGGVQTSPRRPKKTGRDMKVGHQAPKGAQNLPSYLWKLLQEPPGQQASSRKFHLSYQVPSDFR